MNNQPLAYQWKPQTIHEIFGQSHLFGPNSMIDRMVKNHRLFSLIFYGEPGIGKSSITQGLVNDLQVPHQTFNASTDKKEKLVKIIEEAKKNNGYYVILLEEIHRMNRDKQDILLPSLEKGEVVVFACTTENPYFVVNPAIRSRCHILQLKPLTKEELFAGIKQRLSQTKLDITLSDEMLHVICDQTNGDVRSTINIIDILNSLYKDQEITPAILKEVMQQAYVNAGNANDAHYDLLSAFMKSLRGSDPDAAIYYLARLLQSGDFEAINRRIICSAYEDIGLANWKMGPWALAAIEATRQVGWPECKLMYADIVIELCLSPKSNSGLNAITTALRDVENGKNYPIPPAIRDGNYASAAKLGVVGYKYPHEYPNHWVAQQYLPNELKDTKYYIPPESSKLEQELREYWEKIKKSQN